MRPYKLALIEQANSFLTEIESLNPQRESVEWHLSNNLKKFLESVKVTNSFPEIKNATRILSKFCTESMDWDTELYRKCIAITQIGFKLGKAKLGEERSHTLLMCVD